MSTERLDALVYGLKKYCTDILNDGYTICITIGEPKLISKFEIVKRAFKLLWLSIINLFNNNNNKYCDGANRFFIDKSIPFNINVQRYEKN